MDLRHSRGKIQVSRRLNTLRMSRAQQHIAFSSAFLRQNSAKSRSFDSSVGSRFSLANSINLDCKPTQLTYNRVVVEDSHEPQLKVKDENLAPIQQVAILWLLGVKSVHFGGQSPCRRLTSQRGRRSELYLPESVYPFGQGRVTESDEVPID